MLGKAEAKRRMKARLGELPGHLPGGVASVSATWPGEDEMALQIGAMGQEIAARLLVEERRILVTMDLPPMLAMFSGMIAARARSCCWTTSGAERGDRWVVDHHEANRPAQRTITSFLIGASFARKRFCEEGDTLRAIARRRFSTTTFMSFICVPRSLCAAAMSRPG